MSEDRGEADPRLVAALASGDLGRVGDALREARLLVAVVALPGEQAASEGSMALALLSANDGRRALPAFSGVDALVRWSSQARPVPRPAGDVLRYVRDEGLAALVLDPAGPHPAQLSGEDVALLLDGYRLDTVAPLAARESVTQLTAPSWLPPSALHDECRGLAAYAVDADGQPAIAVVSDGPAPGDRLERLLRVAPEDAVLVVVQPDSAPASVVVEVGRRLG